MRARYYIPETLFLSFVYSRRMHRRQFLSWSDTVRLPKGESSLDYIYDDTVIRIAYAVDWVCSRVPWESMCMVRALTAAKMLGRRGYPFTLYMGLVRDGDGKMLAHAWLRVGRLIVTGGNVSDYTATAFYTNETGGTVS